MEENKSLNEYVERYKDHCFNLPEAVRISLPEGKTISIRQISEKPVLEIYADKIYARAPVGYLLEQIGRHFLVCRSIEPMDQTPFNELIIEGIKVIK